MPEERRRIGIAVCLFFPSASSFKVDTPLTSAAPVHPPAVKRARTIWQRRIRDPIVVQLTQGITPEKIALTIAVGSACALFPVFGVTSIICFIAALVLRLNQPIIQILNQLLLPVHVATFVLCVRLGETLFRAPTGDRLELHPRKIYQEYFESFWSHPIQALTHYFKDNADSVFYSIVAWAILLPIYVPLVYYALRPVMRGIVKVKAEVAAKQLVSPPRTDPPIP